MGESYEPVYNDYSVKTPFIIFKNLNNKYGLVTSNGEIKIPFQYDGLFKIDNNTLLEVSKDNKFGIIDEKGKIRIPIQYKEIYLLYDKFDDEELRKRICL